MEFLVLTDTVEDNHCIVDSVTDDSKDSRDECLVDIKADFKKNVNAALNSTLSRTMNTSLTTLITMVAIAIFGGEVIRGLAVALIVGIVVGTYASIFIATPIMFDVTKKAEAKKEE